MRKIDSIAIRTGFLLTIPLTAVLVLAGILVNVQVNGIYNQILKKDIAMVFARSQQIGSIMNEVSDYTKSLRAIKQLSDGTPADKRLAMRNIRHWMPKDVYNVLCVNPDGTTLNSDGSTGTIADTDYFKELIQTGADSIITQPMIADTADATKQFIVLARLTNDTGDFAGFVACTVKLETLSSICQKISFGKTGYGWMIDGAGRVIAHKNADLVFALQVPTADKEKGYKGLTSLGEKIVGLGSYSTGEYGYYTNPKGKRVIAFYSVIYNSPGWSLILSVDEEEYFAKKQLLILMLCVVFVACLVIVDALSFLIARGTAKPVSKAQKAFEQLAEGNADLTAQISSTAKNEVGELVGSFNRFIGKLRDIVVSLKEEQKRLDGISGELKTHTSDTAETVSAMTETINDVVKRTMEQTGLTNDSSAAVNEIASNIESLDNMTASQAASITAASSAIEQMIHNIASITNSMSKMVAEFTGVAAASSSGKDKITEMMGKIEKIVERSEALLEVNKTIANIASMTNLLAMNAAIESAHAGEAGKGFAVVADEIRRLAEDSSNQSKIINKELAEVQRAIVEVASASKESEEAFVGMETRINTTDGLIKEINNALQEQAEGSKQILVSLKDMNDISTEVRSGTGEMREGNKAILSAMSGLKTLSDGIVAEMETLAQKSKEMAEKTENLEQLAKGTTEAVTGMENSIGKFTV